MGNYEKYRGLIIARDELRSRLAEITKNTSGTRSVRINDAETLERLAVSASQARERRQKILDAMPKLEVLIAELRTELIQEALKGMDIDPELFQAVQKLVPAPSPQEGE